MKLQQLRYAWEIARNDLNISKTAIALHTSQPGISKQIRALEDELGVEIFARKGKHLSRITSAGELILQTAGEIMHKIDRIRSLADEYRDQAQGSLSVATTHTQCRYVLPPVISRFIEKFPQVALHMHQGTPEQIAASAADGVADFAIATEALELYRGLVMMPCYRWNRAILLPKSHPLCEESKITLRQIAEFPIVTYTFGFTGRSKLDEAFKAQGLQPQVVFTAADADVIKTYVRLGLGIGIVAKMAYDPEVDADLVAIDASHLFEASVTKIGFRRGTFLRSYMFDFMEMFAPHLTRDLVQAVTATASNAEAELLFARIELPRH